MLNFNPEITATANMSNEALTDADAIISLGSEDSIAQLSDGINTFVIQVGDYAFCDSTLGNLIEASDASVAQEGDFSRLLEDCAFGEDGYSYRVIEVKDSFYTRERQFAVQVIVSDNAGQEDNQAIWGYWNSSEECNADDQASVVCYLHEYENISIEDTKQLTAYLNVADRIRCYSHFPEITAYLPLYDCCYITEDGRIRNSLVYDKILKYFPDYFYDQEAYSSLIEIIAEQGSLNYGLSDLIKLVYDIDALPESYYYYNKMLKLFGITYDFSEYPVRMLRFLLASYMSIRRNRGTSASVKALLHAMDEEFVSNGSVDCPVYIERADFIADNKTVVEGGVLRISYANMRNYDATYYMLGKVMPTGVRYELASKFIYVSDKCMRVSDRVTLDKSDGAWKYLSEELFASEFRSGFHFTQSDKATVYEERGNTWGDKATVSETATLIIYVSDKATASVASIYNTQNIADTGYADAKTSIEEKEGKVVRVDDYGYPSDSATAQETEYETVVVSDAMASASDYKENLWRSISVSDEAFAEDAGTLEEQEGKVVKVKDKAYSTLWWQINQG